MSLRRLRRSSINLLIGTLAALVLLTGIPVLHAQTSVSAGTILGTVTDPSGAVVSDAKVKITNLGTSQVITTATSSAGTYNSGSLIPGNYRVRVEAKGFRT